MTIERSFQWGSNGNAASIEMLSIIVDVAPCVYGVGEAMGSGVTIRALRRRSAILAVADGSEGAALNIHKLWVLWGRRAHRYFDSADPPPNFFAGKFPTLTSRSPPLSLSTDLAKKL